VCDLVPLEKHLDAAGESAHSLGLLSHQILQVKFDLSGLDATLGEVAGLGHVIIMGVVKECLRRYASNVETSSSQSGILLDTHGLHTQLSGLDGSHISSWSRPDDYEVGLMLAGITSALK